MKNELTSPLKLSLQPQWGVLVDQNAYKSMDQSFCNDMFFLILLVLQEHNW